MGVIQWPSTSSTQHLVILHVRLSAHEWGDSSQSNAVNTYTFTDVPHVFIQQAIPLPLWFYKLDDSIARCKRPTHPCQTQRSAGEYMLSQCQAGSACTTFNCKDYYLGKSSLIEIMVSTKCTHSSSYQLRFQCKWGVCVWHDLMLLFSFSLVDTLPFLG